MVKSESKLKLLLTLGLLILTGCTHHIKYEPGAISSESKIAIFSWRVRPLVVSMGLPGILVNSLSGDIKSKYIELNSIASEKFVEQDMLKGISKIIIGDHFIIQPSDYILNSKGKVDLEAIGKKKEADVVLEMSTKETAIETPDSAYNNAVYYWQAHLEVEAKMWRVSDKKILWQKTCKVISKEVFGSDAFQDCSELAVTCLINDISKP